MDHLLVSVKITSPEMPFIGPSRWPMPMNLLKDVEMTKYMHERGKKLEEDIQGCAGNRTAERNPQTLYRDFKKDLRKALRKCTRIAIPKTQAKIRSLQGQLDLLQRKDRKKLGGGNEEDDRMLNMALLQHRITELE